MKKCLKTRELFDCKCEYLKDFFDSHEYPWQMLCEIGALCDALLKSGLDGFFEISDGVLASKDAVISPAATIIPPAIIGQGTQIRPCAYLRGNVITGKDCVIGNSTELKNCILLDNAQAPHYNYIGDSIVGNGAHMGASSICSNLKSDGKNVVIHGDIDYETSLRKIGGILGDGADIGCSCVVNPGTVIGKHTSVYPLVSLRGVYPAHCIVKGTNIIVKRR